MLLSSVGHRRITTTYNGSLIWDARELPLNTSWHDDGPFLPIEFARESADGRITLVLIDSKDTVMSLWVLMNVDNINEAKSALAHREGISDKNIKYSIGFWDKSSEQCHGKSSSEIKSWEKKKNLDGVVWTNLKYGFKESRDDMPEYTQILSHLQALSTEQSIIAEEYVRKTPIQVNTEYRARLETDLKWLPDI